MSGVTRILVVDDEPGIRFFLEDTLTRDGYQVTAVETGEAAVRAIAVQEFDLALVDLKLTGMGGMEVLAYLRQQSPDTAVILLTAHASLDTAVQALRQGAHDYLFKPCKTVELRESVRTGLLRRQQGRRQRILLTQLEESLSSTLQDIRTTGAEKATARALAPFPSTAASGRFLQRGGLIVDSMRHVITLNGHLLELSPTEFDLLAYLISEAPRVVSAQELVREVQGHESEPWEARDIVRYHVYRIRRKMKAAAGRTDALCTVRGVGYTIGG